MSSEEAKKEPNVTDAEKEEEEKEKKQQQKEAEEEAKTVSFQFPFILLKTKRGLNLLDRLAALRFTKHFGSLSLYLFPAVGAIGLSLVLLSVSLTLSSTQVRSFMTKSGPLVNLLIPGLNPYVPLVYGWIALIIAMIVHEGSHGVIARYFKFRVKTSGLVFFTVVLVGAFVDIDEEDLKKAPARKTSRVMAGGPMSNFIVGVASLAVLMLVVSSMTPVGNGIGITGIYQDSPANKAGIQASDMLLAINGTKVTGIEDANNTLSHLKPGDKVTLTLLHDGRQEEKSITLAQNENTSRAFIGFVGIDSAAINYTLDRYRTPSLMSPLIYFFLPTFASGQYQVPYSDAMHSFYTSPLGGATYIFANLFFWLWFVNFNLAIFNALPLYPLDGGQAVRAALTSYGATKGWKPNTAKRIVTIISLAIVALIVSVIAGPYLIR
ncbi:MAG: site-2 protease family protein [Thaumarchaeota archaeon]|nr:site-2 protease family protein [Nitrososphaerota archaeon]MCL5317684.1 site-2 protease family protein [Nitrososphaerota archaeon]